jgi:hypothetical protein
MQDFPPKFNGILWIIFTTNKLKPKLICTLKANIPFWLKLYCLVMVYFEMRK